MLSIAPWQALGTCAEVASAAGLVQALGLSNELDERHVVAQTDPTRAAARAAIFLSLLGSATAGLTPGEHGGGKHDSQAESGRRG